MGKFLTSPSKTEQIAEKGKFILCNNELYKDDDGQIYLAWCGYKTDNFTWIKKADWDIRCSHIHDIGCQYHQLVRVLLNEHQLRAMRLLHVKNDKILCKNIPIQFLEVIDISGHKINNLFYRMLRDADCPKTPKFYQLLYRTGVAFNLGWFGTGKEKINLGEIYI